MALLTGLIAKEAVVSSMSLFYGFSMTDYAAAGAAMAVTFSPAAALAFLVFCALYTPLRGGHRHHPPGDGQPPLDGADPGLAVGGGLPCQLCGLSFGPAGAVKR